MSTFPPRVRRSAPVADVPPDLAGAESWALVVVHPFPSEQLAGTTVLLRSLLQEIRAVDSGVRTEFLHLDAPNPARSLAELGAAFNGAMAMVGVNLHLERHWRRSVDCYEFCSRGDVPAYLWAHDYWPHHKQSVQTVVNGHGAKLLASTATVRDGMADDGFTAEVVQVGISFANIVGDVRPRLPKAPFVVGSAGRLVKRKRYPDVVRAFERAGLEGPAQLHLRVSPSLVYSEAEDDALLGELTQGRAHVKRPTQRIVIHREPSEQHDYRLYSVYVCASDYEGFSMTPIEAIYCGCPALMSDIQAHREIASVLYRDDPAAVMFAPGDVDALAGLLRDEAITGRRHADLAARWGDLRGLIEARWSLCQTARTLVEVVRAGVEQRGTAGQKGTA